MKNPARRLFAA